MKRKALAAAVILSIAAAARVYSFGLGAQFNFSAGEIFAPGAALVISPSDMTHLAINWYIDFDRVNIIGLTLDVCPLNLSIVDFGPGSFNFTLGVGLFANTVFTDTLAANGGLRVPIGFSILLGQRTFEIYTHAAPSWGVNFLPSMELSKRPFYPLALGARFWFR